MNNTPQKENTNEQLSSNEVDLSNVTNRVSGFFNAILEFFFEFIQRLIRYKWISLFLIFLGVGLGIMMRFFEKPAFKNDIVVATNYNSNEYLYNTIKTYKSLVSKAKTPQDSLLLSKVVGIKCEPIPDAYGFLLANYQNMQAFKIMSDRGIDLEKYLKSKIAEKNYRYHTLSFTTTVPKDSTQIVINQLLKSLNETEYFNVRKKFEKGNIQNKRLELQKSVDQLNAIFASLGSNESTSGVNLNDYSNMEQLFMSKEYLLNQINLLDVENLENDKVIYDVFQSINQKKSFPIPAFILLPILFLSLFGVVIGIRNKYILFSKKSKD